jgi:hypothetical protein
MLRKTALLSLLALCACESEVPSARSIVAIEPEEVVSGDATQVTVRLDALLGVHVDYGTRTATLVVPSALQIDEHEVGVEGIEPDGTLRITVPRSMPEGEKDVRVKMPDGSEVVRKEGLKVLPAPPSLGKSVGGGSDTTLAITSFRIERIPNQVRNVPFQVMLRAQGPDAASFDGQVQLTSSKGRLSPNLSGPFSQGTRTEQVTIDHPGGDVSLTVRIGDIAVKSNTFRVAPW